MREYVLPALAGFFTGILSAWGIGGGTLLLLVMSLFLATGFSLSAAAFFAAGALARVTPMRAASSSRRVSS